MHKLLRARLVALATVMIVLTLANAQSATTLDGTYAGVSVTTDGGTRTCVVPAGAKPRPLTIVNGVATWHGGTAGDVTFTGNVTAPGYFKMSGSNAGILNATLDANGQITGKQFYASGFSGGCTYITVWQKK
jgi:hypothetical protein